MLIKGNNLLALHSLKKRFAGKVKLIYIDPPYNTGNDSFKYNDNFTHSTWLTFMKNRLRVARDFLRDDGVIFVQIDDNEQAYLKVLMDEIFGRDNFVATVVWRKRAGGGNDAKHITVEHDYILVYSKNKEFIKTHGVSRNNIGKYKEDKKGFYTEKPLNDTSLQDSAGLHYDIRLPNGIILKGDVHQWKMIETTFLSRLEKKEIIFKPNNKIYYKHYIDINSNLTPASIWYNLALNADSKKEAKGLFDSKYVFSYPKPESLLKRIIEISTEENDLVMDFFSGSGTTMAVAHKMRRRWIGIEQMDYIETITKERLKKVVEGEQGGVSKAVGWTGAGEGNHFVYMEMLSLNEKFKKKITQAQDETQLKKVIADMEKYAFLKYQINFVQATKDADFSTLKLTEQKQILRACLDDNMNYVPVSEIDDARFEVDENTKKLNQWFYGK